MSVDGPESASVQPLQQREGIADAAGYMWCEIQWGKYCI